MEDEKLALFFGLYLLKQPIPQELYEYVYNLEVGLDPATWVRVKMICNAPDQMSPALRGLVLHWS
jgi:hypothetical protein